MIFNELRPWHVVILVVVFLALFGYRKLPDATRSVGRSLRIFKSEMTDMHGDSPPNSAGLQAVARGQRSTPSSAEHPEPEPAP